MDVSCPALQHCFALGARISMLTEVQLMMIQRCITSKSASKWGLSTIEILNELELEHLPQNLMTAILVMFKLNMLNKLSLVICMVQFKKEHFESSSINQASTKSPSYENGTQSIKVCPKICPNKGITNLLMGPECSADDCQMLPSSNVSIISLNIFSVYNLLTKVSHNKILKCIR